MKFLSRFRKNNVYIGDLVYLQDDNVKDSCVIDHIMRALPCSMHENEIQECDELFESGIVVDFDECEKTCMSMALVYTNNATMGWYDIAKIKAIF